MHFLANKNLLCAAIVAGFACSVSNVVMAAVDDDDIRAVAPNTGWAAQNGGTTGGAGATAANTFIVRNKAELVAALTAGGSLPKVVKIAGLIDGSEGLPFTSKADQAARMPIAIPSNTTLIGTTRDSRFINAQITVKNVSNVIIRNVHVEAPWDEYPTWDPLDGATGNWNSEYDAVLVSAATNVWIDHSTFTDGSRTDDQAVVVNGKLQQHHDGLLDIVRGSNYVTVSYNVFENHNKNMLIGNSDSESTALLDRGKLKVTLNNNVFRNITERAPRVRFGQVHAYNNYYQGFIDKTRTYSLGYSLGVGKESALLSQGNVFEVTGAANDGCKVVKGYGGTTFKDIGSYLNGAPLALGAACTFDPNIGWTPPYTVPQLSPGTVKSRALESAGFYKL
jgi:pectate lyase